MAVRDEIILGEGVAIDSGAASAVMRAGSGAIDLLVYGGVYVFVLVRLVVPVTTVVNEALATAVVISSLVVFLVIIPATVETLTRGLSLGRLAVGLRIVRDDGGPVSVRHAFGRALLGFVEVFATFGVVAISASFLSERGKRVGDMLSGTYAMRTRGGRTALPPIAMPPTLQDWAYRADMRRLPDGLALTARLFLGRAGALDPAARYRLGTQIAQELRTYVSPAPPRDHHHEAVIAAIIAGRRDREFVAGQRAERARETATAQVSRLPFGIPDAD